MMSRFLRRFLAHKATPGAILTLLVVAVAGIVMAWKSGSARKAAAR